MSVELNPWLQLLSQQQKLQMFLVEMHGLGLQPCANMRRKKYAPKV
jgi:hypothetical protein